MSDALVISYIPGYTWTLDELITIDKLNLAARPTINLAGTIGTSLVTDNSITTVKLVDGVLSADTAGRAKMADGYFSADATGRGKFQAGFFGAGDAISLALFEDAFWPATAAGRAKFEAGFFAAVSPAIGATKNLLAYNNVGTPNSMVDFTADEVVLKNSSGDPHVAQAINLTVNLTASGVNGLDTGTEAGNVWYYVWVIYNPTSNTTAGLLSTSLTAAGLTLPTGYTFRALVGAVRNDDSSNFLAFYQQDREVFIRNTEVFTDETGGVFTGKTGVTSWTALSGDDLTSFQRLVPPIAKQAWGSAGAMSGGNAGMAVAADANALGAMTAVAARSLASGSVLGLVAGGSWRVPLKTPQMVYYIMSETNKYRLSVSGFKI